MSRRPLIVAFLLSLTFLTRSQVTLIDQTATQQGASVVAQSFEAAYAQYSSFAAEDLVVPSTGQWHLDSVILFGEYATPSGTPVPGAGIIVSIHNDNNGEPGTVVFTDTTTSGADPDSDGSLKYSWESPLVLNPGTYWLVAAARKDFGTAQTQWQWFSSNTTENDTALWVNPGGGFTLNNCPNWTEVTTCYGSPHEGLSFILYGCPGPKPELSGLPQDTSYCSNDSVTFSLSSSISSVSYLWSDGTVGNIFTTDDAGTYIVTVLDTVSTCAVMDSVEVIEVQAPQPQIPDGSICPNGTVVITGIECDSCVQWWSNGSHGDSLVATSPGTYWVLVTDTTTGCSTADTFEIDLLEVDSIQYVGELPFGFCEGDSVTVQISNNFTAYAWSNGSTGSEVTITDPGEVSVTVTSSNGCDRTDTLLILEYPNPEPSIEVDYIVGLYQLYCPGYTTYLWSDGSVTPAIITDGGIISVTVTDSNGCVGSDTVDLPVGTEEIIDQTLSIGPNPVSTFLQVELERPIDRSDVIIRTVQGKVVYQSHFSGKTHTIDLQSLSAGMYILVVSNHHQSYTQRIIKAATDP